MRKSVAQIELVSVDDYPPLLPRARNKQAMKTLRSSETLAKASRIVAARAAELRDAVLELVAPDGSGGAGRRTGRRFTPPRTRSAASPAPPD